MSRSSHHLDTCSWEVWRKSIQGKWQKWCVVHVTKKQRLCDPFFRALSETHSAISLETCKLTLFRPQPHLPSFIQIHPSFRDRFISENDVPDRYNNRRSDRRYRCSAMIVDPGKGLYGYSRGFPGDWASNDSGVDKNGNVSTVSPYFFRSFRGKANIITRYIPSTGITLYCRVTLNENSNMFDNFYYYEHRYSQIILLT